MNCKNCGAKADENERYCPNCGEELKPRKEESFEGKAMETPPEADSRIGSDEGGFSVKDTLVYEEPKKKSKAAIITLVAIFAIALVFGVLVGLDVIKLGDSTPEGPALQVVATMGDYRLNNRDLGYYYWNEVYYLDNSYAQYGMSLGDLLDPELGFDQQEYPGEGFATWHDYFLDAAMNSWARTVAIGKLAADENHQLHEYYTEYLTSFEDNIAADAAYYEYESPLAMLVDDFGDFADVDSYKAYLESRYVASSYTYQMYWDLVDKYSADYEQIESVDVRHILFLSDVDADAAKAKAQSLYDQWLAVGGEDNFAQLATENTEDTASAPDGGLYSGVYPGQMVAAFENWCFDEARQPGDSGIVETEYGFHIMYYVGTTGELVVKNHDEYLVAEEKADAEYSVWMEGVQETLTYVLQPEKVVISQ